MTELIDSVRTKGVLVPVLCRPADDGWELVFGARRLRAAQAAGLAEIPAMVRTMSDREVLEVQVIENLQRADVHPLVSKTICACWPNVFARWPLASRAAAVAARPEYPPRAIEPVRLER